MWISDKSGDLINLNVVDYIGIDKKDSSKNLVYASVSNGDWFTIFQGTPDKCQEYMDELKKELAAFGKMARVKIDRGV